MKQKNLLNTIIYGLMPWNVILALIGIIFTFAYITSLFRDYPCVVIETNCYHSTSDESKCSHVKFAKNQQYNIEKVTEDDAIAKRCKICNECFSLKEQDTYNQLKWFSEHLAEDLGWSLLWLKKDIDYESLYIYLEPNGILHISGVCYELLKKRNAKKLKLSDVNDASTLCDCVNREYRDFIYKKILEGVYDKSLIKKPKD